MKITSSFQARLALVLLTSTVDAYTPSPLFTAAPSTPLTVRHAVQSTASSSKEYTPKWVKKKTLADDQGSIQDLGFDKVGLKGTIPVVFRQGNETRTSMAWAGQPLREVAIQAGQFIQYGCGKGECGTCECNMNGRWVRPCVETVPASAADDMAGDLVIMIKEIKSKVVSSGKFFSIRSFLFGFWNNLLGMVGFVKFRRAARQNWEERKSYEDLVAQKTREKKLRRAAAAAASAARPGQQDGGPAPGLA
jgi:2Fe-2S iron-sulfur cluster binding domain